MTFFFHRLLTFGEHVLDQLSLQRRPKHGHGVGSEVELHGPMGRQTTTGSH